MDGLQINLSALAMGVFMAEIKTALDLIEILMKEIGISWEDLVKEMENGGLINDLGTGIDTNS